MATAGAVAVGVGPAAEAMAAMTAAGARPFDLIYLDADKKGYAAYYEAAIGGGLLRVGGLLAVDNVLFKGRVVPHWDASAPVPPGEEGAAAAAAAEPPPAGEGTVARLRRQRARSLVAANKTAAAIHAFNGLVAADARTEQVLLPLRDGLTLIRRLA